MSGKGKYFMAKDVVIFGAGQIGHLALAKYKDRVDYFIDNNVQMQGKNINGIPVKSVEEGVDNLDGHMIVIASKYQEMMAKQLRDMEVDKYSFYIEDNDAYYETEELVINPYQDGGFKDFNESEWNEFTQKNYAVTLVNDMVQQLQGREVMFNHVEIETVNRCNGNCSFCPVSKGNDTREYKEMTDELFQDIIGQLAEMNYSGRLALFSNNEPFLDSRILQRHKYAREKLPDVRMHLFTNGTLLSIDLFKELMSYLDELIIDNYQQDLKLIKPCQKIVSYCEEHPELRKKVTIILRKPQEILTSRGGDAPNRKKMVSYKKDSCILPYKQLIIRPDGKVSLCCNDPLGKNTLGDLTQDSILDVWNNQRFKVIREALYKGRENWPHCQYCDAFSLG